MAPTVSAAISKAKPTEMNQEAQRLVQKAE